MQYLNLKLNLKFPNISFHFIPSSGYRGQEDTEVVKEREMKNLPPSKRQFLCNFLKLDFLLLGYESHWCEFEETFDLNHST